jgi:hypothetical protein
LPEKSGLALSVMSDFLLIEVGAFYSPNKKLLRYVVKEKRQNSEMERLLGRLSIVASFDSEKSRKKSTLSKKAYKA